MTIRILNGIRVVTHGIHTSGQVPHTHTHVAQPGLLAMQPAEQNARFFEWCDRGTQSKDAEDDL